MRSTSLIENKFTTIVRTSFETRYKNRVGLIFISPWLLGLLLFNLAPILMSLVLSFTDFHLLERDQAQFIGVTNYITVFKDADASRTFGQTLRLALTIVPLQIAASIFFAGLLNDPRLLMKNSMRTLFFLPSIIPAFSAALMWQGYVNPSTGWLNRILLDPVGLGWLNHLSSRGSNESLFILSSLWTIGPSILISAHRWRRRIHPLLQDHTSPDHFCGLLHPRPQSHSSFGRRHFAGSRKHIPFHILFIR
jgi:multiple sugar transport system permease protein